MKSSPPVRTRTEVSAGGVVYRKHQGRTEVALISVGEPPRWQLPKGLVESGETPEAAAVREVQEETGTRSEVRGPLERIEYWYQADEDGERVRIHKFVHFFLLEYRSGNVDDHDQEVREARWVEIGEAAGLLAFHNERAVLERARKALS